MPILLNNRRTIKSVKRDDRTILNILLSVIGDNANDIGIQSITRYSERSRGHIAKGDTHAIQSFVLNRWLRVLRLIVGFEVYDGRMSNVMNSMQPCDVRSVTRNESSMLTIAMVVALIVVVSAVPVTHLRVIYANGMLCVPRVVRCVYTWIAIGVLPNERRWILPSACGRLTG
jgi:hypothetical protein